jgi:hypothetical protein
METGKLQNMRWRVNFFKDLVGCDGQSSSRLQQSIEISGAENIDRAVEEAKRRYERLCHVPLWSLYADRLDDRNAVRHALEPLAGIPAHHAVSIEVRPICRWSGTNFRAVPRHRFVALLTESR